VRIEASALNNKVRWPDVTLTRRLLHALTVNYKNSSFYEGVGLLKVLFLSKNKLIEWKLVSYSFKFKCRIMVSTPPDVRFFLDSGSNLFSI
jgi:hypothetical protein